MMNRTLAQEINQLHAEFCGGLADPNRLLILYTLSEQPLMVNDLARTLQLSQPAVSRHLKILRDHGMVIATRTGTSVEYRLADGRLIQALDLLRAVMRDHLSRQAEVATIISEEEVPETGN
jgi:ArsR family transcriptional regulator, virulence genes transcriptional regulator